jgi:hypothetical protein
MKHIKLIILFVLAFHVLFADSVGHLFESDKSAFIKITGQNGDKVSVDSICIIFPDYDAITQIHPPKKGPWRQNRMDIKNDGYIVYDLQTDFSVVVFSNSKRYNTGLISKYPGHELYIFKIKDDRLVDTTPFFHDYWHIYFVSLFVTLIVETLIGLTYLTTQRKTTFLFTFILINILTHFTAWFIYSHSKEIVPVFFLEIAVMTIESLYWKFFLKSSYEKAVKISILLNLASWIIGAVVTSMI